MTSAPTAAARPADPGRSAGKILLIVFGSLGAFVALGLLVAGLALVVLQTQRDAAGFFTTPTERFSTSAYALTHEGIDIGDASEIPDRIVDRLGTVRVRATSADGDPLFVGIGPTSDVNRYLGGVAHDEVTSVEYSPFRTDTRAISGGAPGNAPTAQTFWAASSVGAGTRSFTWKVDRGNWSLVLMNADASPSVAADVQFGAKAGWVLWLGVVLAATGLLIGLGSAAMIFFGVQRGGGAAVVAGAPVDAAYPVSVAARLDEPLSRWLWLVKWFLSIPHFVVLAFLWMAFAVLTVVAFFAILFTGRYPKQIFDFNLGVLRWTWRVGFYSVSALGTDRYPPFSLAAEPDYPATLDIEYPERLSRGLVLVKSWLLAIPHLIIVALFTGSAAWGWSGHGVDWPGLIEVLTVVAGVILLFRGRYPRDLFDLIVGLNRWVWRVVAYVALMRDEYPPFTLNR